MSGKATTSARIWFASDAFDPSLPPSLLSTLPLPPAATGNGKCICGDAARVYSLARDQPELVVAPVRSAPVHRVAAEAAEQCQWHE